MSSLGNNPLSLSRKLPHFKELNRRFFSKLKRMPILLRNHNEGLANKKKDLLAHEKLPVFDYGKLHPERTRLYAFGSTEQGATGLSDLLKPKNDRKRVMKNINRPVRHQFGDYQFVKDVAVGHSFTLLSAKKTSDEDYAPVLFGAGLNTHSQLGFQAVRAEAPLEVLISFVPIVLPYHRQPKVLALGAGRAHSIVSLENIGLITFGDNSNGQCGRVIINDEKYFGSKLFHKVDKASFGDDEVVSIACRFDVTLCLTRGGKLFSFGENRFGQSGRGRKIRFPWIPEQIRGELENEKIIQVATSGIGCLAVTENGDLFAWGSNEAYHIHPEEKSEILYEPRHVKLNEKIGKVKGVAVGELYSLILNAKGNVYVWGVGDCLGLGPSNKVIRTPTIIPPPLFGRNEFSPENGIVSVSAGFFYAGAIDTHGDLYTWGRNESGCLGLGDMEFQTFPLKVCLNGSAHKLGLGVDHTMVLCKGNI